MTGEFGDY